MQDSFNGQMFSTRGLWLQTFINNPRFGKLATSTQIHHLKVATEFLIYFILNVFMWCVNLEGHFVERVEFKLTIKFMNVQLEKIHCSLVDVAQLLCSYISSDVHIFTSMLVCYFRFG